MLRLFYKKTEMNEIIKFLNSHASVRQFTDQDISNDDEMTIIATAQRSATSSNLQLYSIIGIRQPEKKAELAALCGNQEHVEKSKLFLVFCADLHRTKRINDQKKYPHNSAYIESLLLGVVDASLAACRALMAAQALGIGGVMVGGIRNRPDEVCHLLKMPELTMPVMGMSLGYPKKEAVLKPRLPLDSIYHREQYDDSNLEKHLSQYDRAIEALGYLKGREVEPDKYPDYEGLYSWVEHTARRMASDNPKTYRAHLRQFLEKQGFLMK